MYFYFRSLKSGDFKIGLQFMDCFKWVVFGSNIWKSTLEDGFYKHGKILLVGIIALLLPFLIVNGS